MLVTASILLLVFIASSLYVAAGLGVLAAVLASLYSNFPADLG